MKIGILTFHNADNYGAVLQAYALQTSIKRIFKSDDVYIIDYKNKTIEHDYRTICLKRKFNHFIEQFLYIPTVLHKRRIFEKFRRTYFSLGKFNLSEYDCIVYGSDQVWNLRLTKNDYTYFGKGYAGKKIAYAVSDGGELTFTKEVLQQIEEYSFISCRENILSDRVRIYNQGEIYTVCDPVFLLTEKEWYDVSICPDEEPYVLAYKISENYSFDQQAEKLGKILNMQIIQIVYIKSINKWFYTKHRITTAISPNEFIGYFAHAKYIITTSFHGVAFSILFRKPFFVLKIERGLERIAHLLERIGIDDCLVDEIPSNISCDTKYGNDVEKSIEDYTKRSLDFLELVKLHIE